LLIRTIAAVDSIIAMAIVILALQDIIVTTITNILVRPAPLYPVQELQVVTTVTLALLGHIFQIMDLAILVLQEHIPQQIHIIAPLVLLGKLLLQEHLLVTHLRTHQHLVALDLAVIITMAPLIS
jgi:hypothetical protein